MNRLRLGCGGGPPPFLRQGKQTAVPTPAAARQKSVGIKASAATAKAGAGLPHSIALGVLLLMFFGPCAYAQKEAPKVWHPVEFAIVKLNDVPPIAWNMYHTDKKGVILLHLWKRYLLINMLDEEAYDLDPDKVKSAGDSVEWSYSELPLKAIDTPDWRERDIGTMRHFRFKLGGPDHHYLELQIPLMINGKPLY